MRISIFGMGYVGCVSGACLAALGHRVVGVEPNPVKVKLINSGKSPIVEKDLDTLLEKSVGAGLFSATENWREAVENSDLAIVCVGTPSHTNGSIDLRFVWRVCEQIGHALAQNFGNEETAVEQDCVGRMVFRVAIGRFQKRGEMPAHRGV